MNKDDYLLESKKKIKSDLKVAAENYRLISTDELICGQLVDLAEQSVSALRNNAKIIFAGNGGSFGDSQHLAAELISRLQFDRSPLPALALGTNSSAMTAVANDFGYSHVFARELSAIASKGDVFIPISTSGNSANVLKAVDVAIACELHIVGFTGESGGDLASKCKCIKIPSNRTERIQEGHILIGHMLCVLIEDLYFSKIQ